MSNDPLEIVPLHTGDQVTKAIAQTTWIALRVFMERHPMAFLDLADWIRNPEHELYEETVKVMSPVWQLGESMNKDTLLTMRACVVGEDYDLRVVNPFTGR